MVTKHGCFKSHSELYKNKYSGHKYNNCVEMYIRKHGIVSSVIRLKLQAKMLKSGNIFQIGQQQIQAIHT